MAFIYYDKYMPFMKQGFMIDIYVKYYRFVLLVKNNHTFTTNKIDDRREVYRMKSGKNPTRDQKKLLTQNNKNCNEWLFIQMNGPDSYVFRHRETGEVITLTR